jgi:hypothetical protein
MAIEFPLIAIGKIRFRVSFPDTVLDHRGDLT